LEEAQLLVVKVMSKSLDTTALTAEKCEMQAHRTIAHGPCCSIIFKLSVTRTRQWSSPLLHGAKKARCYTTCWMPAR
jgi:hypothetical protein